VIEIFKNNHNMGYETSNSMVCMLSHKCSNISREKLLPQYLGLKDGRTTTE